jgi:putative transcriptional regulator
MAVSDADFANVMEGLGEAADYVRGARKGYRVHVPETVDVKSIRTKLDMSQAEFAVHYGFSVNAVRDWEQKRRRPEAAARVLLKVIDHDPAVVERALVEAGLIGVLAPPGTQGAPGGMGGVIADQEERKRKAARPVHRGGRKP